MSEEDVESDRARNVEMTGTVLTALEGGVRRITLNRADWLNAADEELLPGLRSALADANADDGTRVVRFDK